MNTNKSKKRLIHWEIYPRNLYIIHEVNGSEHEGPRAELLAECTAPGRLTGHFRWAFGGGNVEASCTISSIMDVGEIFWLEFDISPQDIDIRENNCAGPWEDLADWIAKDKIGVKRDNVDAKTALLGKPHKKKFWIRFFISKKRGGGKNLIDR